MRGSDECEIYRKQIAFYNEGWLSDTAHIAMTRHLAVCEACSAEANADEQLCLTLADMPEEDAPLPLWATIRASRDTSRRRFSVSRRLVASGAAIAVSAFACAFLPSMSRHAADAERVGETRAVMAEYAAAEMSALAGAHMALNTTDVASDPTRTLIQLCALHQQEKVIR